VTRDHKEKPPARTARGASWMSLLVGLFSGLVIGLAIAFVVAWYVNKMPNPFAQKANGTAASRSDGSKSQSARTQPAPKAEPRTDAKAEQRASENTDSKVAKIDDGRPRFDFYKILPGSEETLSEQDLKRSQQKPASPASKAVYFLQAGAFQNAADADNMKARLVLMGMEVSIQTAAIPDKGMLHRVRVGPFESIDDLNKVRATLKENGVQSTAVKVGETAGR